MTLGHIALAVFLFAFCLANCWPALGITGVWLGVIAGFAGLFVLFGGGVVVVGPRS